MYMRSGESKKVKDYFERVAGDFDSIYSGKKSRFMQWLDKVFRKDMYERYRLTLEECRDPEIQSVLDIGCGSGRFCLPLAKEKNRVVGIDFSGPMLEIARSEGQKAGVSERCDFREGDFMQMNLDGPFDAILAIGLFDYIREPAAFLAKIRGLLKRKAVATWPAVWTWRALPRWIRLNLQGCPVFFFTPSGVRSLYQHAGLKIVRFERIGKIYFVVAEPAA